MARPRLVPNNGKRFSVNVYLPEDEYTKLAQIAVKNRLSKSMVLREMIKELKEV